MPHEHCFERDFICARAAHQRHHLVEALHSTHCERNTDQSACLGRNGQKRVLQRGGPVDRGHVAKRWTVDGGRGPLQTNENDNILTVEPHETRQQRAVSGDCSRRASTKSAETHDLEANNRNKPGRIRPEVCFHLRRRCNFRARLHNPRRNEQRACPASCPIQPATLWTLA